ncbi:RNA polymerase sigma factor [Sphingobacterium bovistauri]|uniref:Sigma-70 family RNA polymerase sigma factor n=1 Tax=Sphingobacterium bovistauri TaxID=2781959 RepID=A0ABS7ZAY5_9SPHI|nr:sigma-70 family RNA polymerase sigma factor [Sphingobacterium bovistauri]MCA5006752.1 sigma-70 family RNA polymerase sigma factor [Sphingobacterium bovistauri]
MKELEINSDTQLCKLLIQGDHKAFASIFNKYKRQLATNLYKLLRSEEITQDILQETFIALWENREKLDDSKPLKSYIFTIAANKTKNVFRKAATDENYKSLLLEYYQEDYNPILDNIYRKENLQLLDNLLSKLSPQQKTIIQLSKIELRTHKEIASLLGLSEQTVNTHVRDANKKLKSLITTNIKIISAILVALS